MYRFFAKINHFLNFAFVINSLVAIQIDMLIPALVNTRSMWVDPFKLLLNSGISFIVLLIYANLTKKLMIKSYFLEKYRRRYGRYPETEEDRRNNRIEEMKAEIEDIKTEKQLETLKNPGEKSHKLQELKRQREDEQFK